MRFTWEDESVSRRVFRQNEEARFLCENITSRETGHLSPIKPTFSAPWKIGSRFSPGVEIPARDLAFKSPCAIDHALRSPGRAELDAVLLIAQRNDSVARISSEAQN